MGSEQAHEHREITNATYMQLYNYVRATRQSALSDTSAVFTVPRVKNSVLKGRDIEGIMDNYGRKM